MYKNMKQQHDDIQYLLDSVLKWDEDFKNVVRFSQGVPHMRGTKDTCMKIKTILIPNGEFDRTMKILEKEKSEKKVTKTEKEGSHLRFFACMESLYSSPAYFENHNEGERSCPDFDKLIQRAESENSELLRILEEETQKTLALQKGLELQNKRREEHERSTNQLNEEVKELHKRFLQSKETNERAEMYIEMSNTNNLAKQKLSEQQQKEREIQEMEKEKNSPRNTVNDQEMATSTSTTMKSPGVQSSHSSPKTPTSGQHSDIFNFCDYRERMKQMNKSPGEGFAYQSRPMFESIAEEEGSGDISTADVQTSFFQPFFKPRQQEISDQFSDTPTFFNMSPNKDQEEMVQPSNNFQAHNNTSSTSLCGSLFSMSTRPDKESKESTSGGFTLFGDQLTPKSGNQGNQLSTPKSPDFTFNFGVSPPISEERSTNQGGTFNLF
ncbi:hypothetical protein QZH41_013740 [Actinostola sp. cb2023]|nr:hypothetical protein QZH41_013740 [Actinostola sp. cb2023]